MNRWHVGSRLHSFVNTENYSSLGRNGSLSLAGRACSQARVDDENPASRLGEEKHTRPRADAIGPDGEANARKSF